MPWQKFRSEWLNNPILKDWIREDEEDEGNVFCIYCKRAILANFNFLFVHAQSNRHKALALYATLKFNSNKESSAAMVGRDITPTEIGKHSRLIKAAQEEMSSMDVLVCGRCLSVFHFIDDFKQHKQLPCHKENNNVRECNDTKPKIWAFLLWKATQLNNNKDANQTPSPNSWALYQTWVKMDENLRETWIVAGKTIQSFAKVGQGGLQEMPVKITKTVVNNNADGISPGRKPLTQTKPQVANLKPPQAKLPVLNKSHDSENDASPIKTAMTTSVQQKIIKKPAATPTPASAAAAVASQQSKTTPAAAISKTTPMSRRAKRTVPNSDEITEENVEKIVAKRFNPRRKMHEYLVKWESRSHEQNTWEPASYLENVPHLLETFEKQLARQKETRAALQAQQQAAAQAATNKTDVAAATVKKETVPPLTKSIISGGAIITPKLTADALGEANKLNLASPGSETSSMRPSRTSKTKAMDQVKQWVTGTNAAAAAASTATASPSGGGADANADGGDKLDWSMNTSNSSIVASGGIKRKLLDDSEDFNDSNASDLGASSNNAMATMEDFEEDLIPSHSVKRMKNGNAISVEVKTKNESKVIKVNGTTSRQSSVSGESLPVGPNSAEVIITQDTNASGVVKKPGFSGNANSQKTEAQIRVLSKGESAVSSTGIVRLGSAAADTASETTSAKPQLTPRTQQIRVGGGRQTPTVASSSTIGNTQITTISQRSHTVQRTPGGTTIQRKQIGSTPGHQRPVLQSQARTTTLHQQTSPSSGRMIIPRQGTIAAGGTASARQAAAKHVTPEQKILQLSKSGDLKVTKKVMTREDAVAQRMTPQQQRQHLLRQREQQQSQVQIQKVQQIAPPTTTRSIGIRKQSESAYHHQQQQQLQQQQEEPHQAQLCPITGKIIGEDGQEQQPELESPQPTVAEQQQQQQLALQQQQQEQQQQQLHDIDPTLLLTNEQQMLTNEDGTPLLVTGEDGTVYQVAGKNAEGQTILVTQGPDGEQQFAYVAAAEGEENQQVMTLDNAVAEAVAHMPAEHQQSEAIAGEGQYLVKTTQEDGTTQVVTMTAAELEQHQALAAAQQQQQQQQEVASGSGVAAGGAATGQLCIQTGDSGDGQEANIPAEVVQADLPSPGGTRRVVLLLQDGTFMMTEMHDDEFKSLNIAT